MDPKIKIAGKFTKQYWLDMRNQLCANTDNNWNKAYEIFELRIKSRFLEPIRRIKKGDLKSGEGFSIAVLGIVLLEQLASFYFGRKYTYVLPSYRLAYTKKKMSM